VKEYVDFLGSQPPYDALTGDELLALVSRAQVEYFAAGTVVVSPGNGVLDHLWVVRTGALDIIDNGRLIDELGPGDTFGHVSVLSQLPPGLTVRAVEDSLCLRLPDPRTVLKEPKHLKFSYSGALIGHQRLIRDALVDRSSRPVRELMRRVVLARGDELVRTVARRIGDAAHSCALVQLPDASLGIVTDRDFRERVATGQLTPDAPVAELATFPALTVSEDFSQAAGFARMVDRGVHHLVVVDRRGAPVGVLRVVDFAASDIRSPLLIRSAIDTATGIEELAAACRLLQPSIVELAAASVPSLQIGNLVAAVVDAVLRKLVALGADTQPYRHNRPGSSGPDRSWIVLGSMARREPLPSSDVDTALVWADPDPDGGGAEGHGAAADPTVVRAGAEATLQEMERCGLRRCAEGANASNPLFSRTRATWTQAAGRWLTEPDSNSALLLSSIVIDSRPLTQVALGRTLTDMMGDSTRTTLFLHAFLLEALAVKPPTGFVRNFVIDHSGAHRGELNLKTGGLLPIAALGRFVAAVTGDSRGSTIDRLRRGADAAVLTRDESDTLIGAFEQVYDLLFSRDIAALSAGGSPSHFLDPKTLDMLTRRHLRESFRAIALVQASVESTWMSRLRG